MVVDEGIWPSNHETRLTSNENKADKNKWCFRLLKQKLIQVLLVGVLKDINPLESHPNISKLRQPDNLERSSFKAKHSNMIAPLSRFQDVVWLHIHIYKYNVYIYIYIMYLSFHPPKQPRNTPLKRLKYLEISGRHPSYSPWAALPGSSTSLTASWTVGRAKFHPFSNQQNNKQFSSKGPKN